jgi:hypothetical protein
MQAPKGSMGRQNEQASPFGALPCVQFSIPRLRGRWSSLLGQVRANVRDDPQGEQLRNCRPNGDCRSAGDCAFDRRYLLAEIFLGPIEQVEAHQSGSP